MRGGISNHSTHTSTPSPHLPGTGRNLKNIEIHCNYDNLYCSLYMDYCFILHIYYPPVCDLLLFSKCYHSPLQTRLGCVREFSYILCKRLSIMHFAIILCYYDRLTMKNSQNIFLSFNLSDFICPYCYYTFCTLFCIFLLYILYFLYFVL